jgi:hypothetical protein
MNNIEIIKLVESKSGKIPLLVKPQILDIFEAYDTDISNLPFKNPVFEIDMLFKRLHKQGIRDDRFSLLERSLSTGKLFSKTITSYLFENSLNSPFFPVNYDFDILDNLIDDSKDDKTIEIIIKGEGKQGKGKVKYRPKGSI